MINSDENKSCNVCYDEFSYEDEAVLVQLPCKHIYHEGCLKPWLESHNTCPGCRFELPTDDIDYENNKLNSQDPNYMRNLLREANSAQGSNRTNNQNSNNGQNNPSNRRGGPGPSYFF
jgi:E3 ubiquitin-protein ligase RNF115/126